MSSKRYSVWGTPERAIKEGPVHIGWEGAHWEHDARQDDELGDEWRIWRHNDDGTVTDVTDGEPEPKWWQCNWNSDRDTVICEEAETLIEGWWTIQAIGKEYRWVHANIRSATAPTPEQFQAHVLAETGVEVPCVEEAQWWHWQDGEWNEAEAEMSYVAAYDYPWASKVRVNVYGTVSNRDEKRDALLAAAKAAGKPEEES